jgi:hypothetical protein
MTRGRILLAVLYAAGVVAAGILVVTKNEELMNVATAGMYDDGDLYRFAKVLLFKTEIPAPLPEEAPLSAPEEDTAAVIMIGDSFLESRRGHRPLPAMLSERLREPVVPVYAGYAVEFFDPVYYCWKVGLDPERRRIIILERVERYVIPTFGTRRDTSEEVFEEMAGEQEETWWGVARRRWFTEAERNHEVFLTSSDCTAPVVEVWNTFRFLSLGQISGETPVYSLTPPFLFEKEEALPGSVTSFYYPHTDSLVEAVADVIGEMGEILRTRYNAELVFMPVPGSYTLYHGFVCADTYDEFLPRLCAAVERRGTRTIPLYRVFRDSDEVLFFPTDTHWNAKGAGLALREILRVVEEVRAGW